MAGILARCYHSLIMNGVVKTTQIVPTADDHEKALGEVLDLQLKLNEQVNQAIFYGHSDAPEIMALSKDFMCYYIFAENFKPKPLEYKVRKFESFLNKTNTANLILTKALTWKLANYYINMSEQNQLNQKNNEASKNIDLAA